MGIGDKLDQQILEVSRLQYQFKDQVKDVENSLQKMIDRKQACILTGSVSSAFSVSVVIKASSGHVCSCEKELVVFSLLLKLLKDIPPEAFSRT